MVNFWLLIFALVPNPLWYMLNPSTDLLFAALFAVFYMAYCRDSRRAWDTTLWFTVLVLILLTRPNGYSILLFVYLDALFRLPGGSQRNTATVAALSVLIVGFGLYLYPYFVTEVRKTAQAVQFFGVDQSTYLQGIFTDMPGWLDAPLSWLALAGAKILYFVGLRPSYAEVSWPIVMARAAAGIVFLPGLFYVMLKGGKRHRLLIATYCIPVFADATQDRYNLALQPVLFLFWVQAFAHMWRGVRGRVAATMSPTA